MIDLHIHALPGIDDGAGSWAEAEEMCRMAAADGCEQLVVTPHQRRQWPNENRAELLELLAELEHRIGSRPTLHLGGEIRVDSTLLDDLERDDLGGLCPLADSRWLLLEFDQIPPASGAGAILHEVRLAGWKPLIAHPEFIPFLAEDFRRLETLIAEGARSQVTAMSVAGGFGGAAQLTALQMIDRGLAHVVASDAHTPDWRPPGLAAARAEIERRWGSELAEQLVARNPRAVLEDAEIPLPRLA